MQSSLAGRLLRASWLLFGSAVLYAAWVAIVLTSARLPSLLDALMWATVGLMLVARRLDITRFAGRTAHGEPAARGDWPRYAAVLIVAVALGQFIAHYLGGSLTS